MWQYWSLKQHSGFVILAKKKNLVDVTVAQSLMTLHVKTNQWIRVGGFPANAPHQAQRMGLLSQPSHCTGGDKHTSPRSVRSGVLSCGSEQQFRECVPWTWAVGISGINMVKTPWRNQRLFGFFLIKSLMRSSQNHVSRQMRWELY